MNAAHAQPRDSVFYRSWLTALQSLDFDKLSRGLQLRGLRKEIVDTKRMTEKAFHDEILRQGSMPISLLRLALGKEKLTRDMNIDWQFYGDLPTAPVVKQRFPFGTLIMSSNLKENVLVRLPGCAR